MTLKNWRKKFWQIEKVSVMDTFFGQKREGAGMMFTGIRNTIRERMAGTVFADAVVSMKYLYKKGARFLAVLFLLSYLAAMLLTGCGALLIENIKGNHYQYGIGNVFAAWFKYGRAISLVVYLPVQMIMIRLLCLFTTGYRRDEEKNYDVSNEGTYGTSNNMSEQEMKETFTLEPLEDIKATILGRNPYNPDQMVGQKHPLMKLNRNVFMVAGPSAGKSATFVIPLIMQVMRRGESAIISDPKSELFKICSELGKLLKYEIRILNLNPMFLDNSDPCNFMSYVGDDIDKAQVMSNAIISNTTIGDSMFDFWTEGPLNLLQAVILRINTGTDYLPEEKNLPMLFTYLTENSLDQIEADFENLPSSHPATAPFLIFKDGEDKVKKQVLQGLRIKLKLFNSVKLKKILSRTEGGIDILNPGRKRCLYFVGSNDQDSSMAPVVSLFYTLLYQELVRYADMRNDQQLPITVHMILDEYANMGTIPDFEKKLSTVRSRNIVTYIICQDINQLKEKHPRETWRTVLNDCDYYMMLKTNDQPTMEWWSQMAGDQTINVKNRSYYRGKTDVIGLHNAEKVTEGIGTRKLYTEHEIRTLKEDEVLLLVSQRNMIKLKTFFWKNHPYGKYLERHADSMYVLPSQHYPFWKLIEDGIVSEDFDYDEEPSYVMEIRQDEKLVIDRDYDPDAILQLKGRDRAAGGKPGTGRKIGRFRRAGKEDITVTDKGKAGTGEVQKHRVNVVSAKTVKDEPGFRQSKYFSNPTEENKGKKQKKSVNEEEIFKGREAPAERDFLTTLDNLDNF